MTNNGVKEDQSESIYQVLNERFFQMVQGLSGVRSLSSIHISDLSKVELLDKILIAIHENFDLEQCSIFLLEDKVLRCVAGKSWQETLDKKGLNTNTRKTQEFKIGEGIVGLTAERKQLFHSHNCKLDHRYLRLNNDDAEEYSGSLLCIPILTNNELMGVLNISHPHTNFFHAWQENIAMIYADIIGMFLHNHRLLHNMEACVEERSNELLNALQESETLRKRFEEMAILDPLTKIYNRRFFFPEVNSAIARAKRHARPICVLLMDLDKFKSVNDLYGHDAGDAVLKELGNLLTEVCREGDILARFGGEEFVIALPDTDIKSAMVISERIRKNIAKHEFQVSEGKIINVTASIGISCFEAIFDEKTMGAESNVNDLIRDADRAMYRVKQKGGDAIEVYK